MSPSPFSVGRLRRRLLTAAAAAAALGGVAVLPSVAQASPPPYRFTVLDGPRDYRCSLPGVGLKPVATTVDLSPTIVGTYPMMNWTLASAVEAMLPPLDLPAGATISGTAKLSVKVSVIGSEPSVPSTRVESLTIAPTVVSGDDTPLKLTATGSSPFSGVHQQIHWQLEPASLTLNLQAVDAQGEAIPAFEQTGLGDCESTDPVVCLAVMPQAPRVTEVSHNSARLSWPPSDPGFCPIDPVGFKVYVDGVEKMTVTDPYIQYSGTTLTGLQPSTQYSVTVRAFDAAGKLSRESMPATVTTSAEPTPTPTPEPVKPLQFGVSGSSELKTLARGSVPLAGSFDGTLDVASGAVDASLALNPTRARLVLGGAIPVTAQIAFVQSGRTTGSLIDGVLKTSSRMKVRLPKLYLFGAIEIGGGGNCQTRQLSDVQLTSVGAFGDAGGQLAGTFAISDLSGCGALNGLISPLVAGGGNTMALNLTKR